MISSRSRKSWWLACSLVVYSAVMVTGQRPQNFMAYGPTTQSCGTFSARDQDSRRTFEWWVLGFVSGAGRESEEPFEKTDSAALEAWIAKYCVDHPLDPFTTAAIKLVDELKARAK